VTVWYGQQLTSAARTAIDIARSCGVTAGVVALDAVLHERAAEPAEVEQILKHQTGWPYSRRAHRAVDLADGRSESVLETLVRVCLVSRGVPRPELQVWVDTARGRYRVDMLWPDARVVVEADGLEKYRAGWQTVVDEKCRHEAIERAGYAVLRVTWRELMSDADDVARRVLAALAR
jgi:very-short-patch-repair endonuclease